MPLESTMICLDNSEWMRNGDYIPTRMEAQHDAANLLCGSKTQANPESTVGVLTMAGKGPELLVSPTDDMGKILASLHDVPIAGKTNFSAGIQIAQLALKHRRNKHGGQRIIIFISSPIEDEIKTLVKVGKLLKKNNVALDVVSMGEIDQNQEKLQGFIDAANSGDNCHLVSIPPGILPSDVLISSPIISMEGGAGGGGGGGLGAGAGGDFGGAAEFGGVDPNADPELAMALRVSMEEERARQEAASQATTTSAPANADATAPGDAAAASGAGVGAGAGESKGEGTDESKLGDAMQVDQVPQSADPTTTTAPAGVASEAGTGLGASESPRAALGTGPTAEMEVDDEEKLLQQALAMSMEDGEQDSMRLALEMSMAEDAGGVAGVREASSGLAPTPAPPSSAAATPPPAPPATAGGSGEFYDLSFVKQLLGQIPDVDPNDPRIKAAMEQISGGDSASGVKKEGEEGEGKEGKGEEGKDGEEKGGGK